MKHERLIETHLKALRLMNSISSPVYTTRKSLEICVRTSAFRCLLTFKAFGVTSTSFTSLDGNLLNNTRYIGVVRYYNITTKLLRNWKPARLIEDPEELTVAQIVSAINPLGEE